MALAVAILAVIYLDDFREDFFALVVTRLRRHRFGSF
jgi:hypothetical protein